MTEVLAVLDETPSLERVLVKMSLRVQICPATAPPHREYGNWFIALKESYNSRDRTIVSKPGTHKN